MGLKEPFNDNLDEDNLEYSLHRAILDEDIELVKELLKNSADADSYDDEGNSALYNACKTNNYELVELILEYAEVNDNDYSCSALSATDDEAIIDLLFIYGAIRELDFYSDCRYYSNYEMVFGFDDHFRNEVIMKTLEYHNKSLDGLIVDKKDLEEVYDGFLYELKLLGIRSIYDSKLNIDYETDPCSVNDLIDLFERLGYEILYEGSNNKLEGKIGIYFIR